MTSVPGTGQTSAPGAAFAGGTAASGTAASGTAASGTAAGTGVVHAVPTVDDPVHREGVRDARLRDDRGGLPASVRPHRAGPGVPARAARPAEPSESFGTALRRLRTALGPLFGPATGPALEAATDGGRADSGAVRADARLEKAALAYRRAGAQPRLPPAEPGLFRVKV